MKKITQFSVQYPITVLMFILAVLLLGYISFRKLGVDLFPNLKNPRIFVEVKSGERPPEEMEKQYVDRLEALIIRQQNVTQVSSVSRVGTARITVEYNWKADMDQAFLDLQKTLTSFNQGSDLDELNITQYDPNTAPVILVAFSHPEITDMDELRKVAENYIRNELIRLEGIAEVELSGQEEEEVVITTDSYLLQAFGLSVDDVANRITTFNRNVSGGSIVEMGTRYIIKGVGVFENEDDIRNLIVGFTTPQGATSSEQVPVFLKDVATVTLSNMDPENIVQVNGKRCLGLSIYKEPRFNTVNVVRELSKELKDLSKSLPGYEFTIIDNQGTFIQNAVNEVKQAALIGVLLAVLVLFIFLRRLGTTVIISLAIPISVVATFNLMYFSHLSLNIMTLGGLALGAGMLVDNAIVVMENIFRNLEAGHKIKEAAVEGTAQVGGAITASTITTIVVFLPIVYLRGAAGELFKDQALTVTFALLSSLVVALLVIPMLSTRFMPGDHFKKAAGSISFPGYPALLKKVLSRRWWVISGALVLIALSIIILPLVGSEFVPRAESGSFSIQLRLPEGTALSRTDRTVHELEDRIRQEIGPAVKTIYSRVGPISGLSGNNETVFEDENTALMKIILDQKARKRTAEIIATVTNIVTEVPDLEADFIQDETALRTTLGTDEAPILVEVRGEDLDKLQELTDQVKQKISDVPGLLNVETSFEAGAPEVDIEVDRLRAGLFNMGVSQISSQVEDRLKGRDSGQWEHEGELKTISIRLPKVGVGELENIELQASGQKLLLSDVADITVGRAPREIYRTNQTRVGRVTAQLEKGVPFNHAVAAIEKRLSQIDFPPDYSARLAGEEQKRQDALGSLGFALLLSVILVYMVLASQFESLLHPFTILLTIPLAGVGVVLLFFILGHTFNMMAYIGIIMLAGIAVNDSIILVDTINRLRAGGMDRLEAIIEGGRQRIRPIIMTSLTTILALLPLTLGLGEGVALRSPMALAVIGGLTTSTLLTLIVIPCVYLTFDRAKDRVLGKK